jgi:hypothetical protein
MEVVSETDVLWTSLLGAAGSKSKKAALVRACKACCISDGLISEPI